MAFPRPRPNAINYKMMDVQIDGKTVQRAVGHYDQCTLMEVPQLYEGEIIQRTLSGEVHILKTGIPP